MIKKLKNSDFTEVQQGFTHVWTYSNWKFEITITLKDLRYIVEFYEKHGRNKVWTEGVWTTSFSSAIDVSNKFYEKYYGEKRRTKDS